MKAFVINLERSTIRRAFMKKQLDEQGIAFEFVKAVDGATLSDKYLAEICDFEELTEKRPHLLRKGVYGCLLSHYSVYQRIVAENLPYALIMEDDIEIQTALKPLLQELESVIRKNEVILLFSQNNYMPTILSEQNTETILGKYKVSYPMQPWALGSAAGYIISREAAQGLIDLVLPIRYAADGWSSYYYDKAIQSLRCITPFPVKPAGFKSDIDYVSNATFRSKVLSFINTYNIFPFKQFLDRRRKRALDRTTQYSFTPEVSPMVTSEPV